MLRPLDDAIIFLMFLILFFSGYALGKIKTEEYLLNSCSTSSVIKSK